MTPNEIRREFDMRVAVPDGQDFVARYQQRSEVVRGRLNAIRDVRYGAGPRQLVDIFPTAAPNAPTAMFWHGGGWRYQSKEHFSYIAEPLVAAGVNAVVVGYDLHPDVTLLRMMDEACEAVAWCVRNAGSFGGDPSRIAVCGHSAGAQLCGMSLAHDFTAEGLPRSPICGALLISGSYDMAPHGRHERYLDMGLADVEFVRKVSPSSNPPLDPRTKLVLAIGSRETSGYIAQAESFYRECIARGHDARVLLSPGDHHFSVIERLAEPDHTLTQALIGLAGG
jgi:arylformamidase